MHRTEPFDSIDFACISRMGTGMMLADTHDSVIQVGMESCTGEGNFCPIVSALTWTEQDWILYADGHIHICRVHCRARGERG